MTSYIKMSFWRHKTAGILQVVKQQKLIRTIFFTVWALCRIWWPSFSLIKMQTCCLLGIKPVIKNFSPAFSVGCLPQCIDLFLFPLDGVPQQLLVLPLFLAQLTQQPENAMLVSYSAESVTFVTWRYPSPDPPSKTVHPKSSTRIGKKSKKLTKKNPTPRSLAGGPSAAH